LTVFDDPVAALLELAEKVTQREPRYLLPGELWVFMRILTAITISRRDWIAEQTPETATLLYDALQKAREGIVH
jgi:hypothetical protein